MYSKYLQNSCNTSISVGETSYNRLITFKRSAYSLAEVFIAIIIVGSIALLLLSMTARNRQHEFNAKLNKAEASISSILEKDFILNTGREAADYQAEPIRSIIKEELKVGKDCTDNSAGKDVCWAENSYGDYSTEKLLLKDNTSVALKDVAGDGVLGNFVTTYIFIDANGPKGPNELNKDIRSLKITASKDRLNIASHEAGGECLCPNGRACFRDNIYQCNDNPTINMNNSGTCKCLDGTSCTTLNDCPAIPPEVSGECKCSDGTACPAGNAKLCGGTISGTCKCSNGNSCPGGTIASCVNNGGCVCPNGVACPNGDSTKCTAMKSVGVCKCPDNKPCPDNDLRQCPNIGGCVCPDGTSCPDGKTTASCFRCEKTCSKGYSVSDMADPNCTCEKNCKIESCKGKQTIIGENSSSCYCGCANKNEHANDTKYEFDDVNCSWSCKNKNDHANDNKYNYDDKNCTWSCSNDTSTKKNYDSSTVKEDTPSTSNGCEYRYSCKNENDNDKLRIENSFVTCDGPCKNADKIITIDDANYRDLLNTLTSCINNGGISQNGYSCGPYADQYSSQLNINLENDSYYDSLYYFEYIINGQSYKDFFAKRWEIYDQNIGPGHYNGYTHISSPIYHENLTNYYVSVWQVNNIITETDKTTNQKSITMVCLKQPEQFEWDFACYSPLSFDLDGNGITTKEEMVEYDINGDGKVEIINDSADAVLCFDRDKDGVCGKDGSELFGDNTRFGFEDKDFKGYADGFDALRALAKHEGLISENDNILDEKDIKYLEDKWGLRIKKGGYLSQAEKLTDNKITSISTNDGEKHWYENFDNKGNNLMKQDGATFVIDNKTNIFADIWHTITDFVGSVIDSIVDAVTGLFN